MLQLLGSTTLDDFPEYFRDHNLKPTGESHVSKHPDGSGRWVLMVEVEENISMDVEEKCSDQH